MDELLRIHMLTVELPTTAGWVRPVNEVTLCIAPGEALGLVGESGSGKTMLSLAMMGLLPPGARVSGEAFLNTADGQPKNLTNLNEPESREAISAPTFRGPAATRHDRHGAGRAPQAADCR